MIPSYWAGDSADLESPGAYDHASEVGSERPEMCIRDRNSNGIEVILDVVFNHTAEGNENGPFFSFKGFDNRIYYIPVSYTHLDVYKRQLELCEKFVSYNVW